MSENQNDPKAVLAELIDAYASARVTNNETLIKMSVGHLNAFINAHDIVAVEEELEES